MKSLSALLLTVSLPAAAAVAPHASWTALPFSNGYGAAVYDTQARRLNVLLPHLYQAWDEATPTVDLLFDAYWGLRVDGAGTWLTEVAPSSVEVLEGTGVVRVIASWSGVKVTTWWWAPWGIDGAALATAAKAEVTDGQPHAVSLYTIHNLHLGGTPTAPAPEGESASWDGVSIAETGSAGRTVHAVPLAPPSHVGMTPENPYPLVAAGEDLTDTASGAGDDVVTGLQWDAALAPGQALHAGVALTVGGADQALAWRGEASPPELVTAELGAWKAWLGDGPGELPVSKPAWEQLARRALPYLRMAQVRETNTDLGTPNGQILASLPPGQWNIAWVRDGAYAIAALARTGHAAEARAALEFWMEGDAGDYEAEVGLPYAISVCRYFGNGDEWSDGGDTPAGPNIEYDDFGLALWAARAYVDASGDEAWLSQRWGIWSEGVADVLVALRDPDTGLLPADSSIWEHHWNGNQKRFAYTQIAGARGLCDASSLAARVGDTERAEAYAKAAHGLRAAILKHYVLPGGALLGNLEEPPATAIDGAAIEAVPLGLVPPGGTVAKATTALFDEALAMATGHGYKRNDDLDWYDRQEWVYMDLRMAVAWRLGGEHAAADALLDWVAAQSLANYGLIAELYEEATADYEGAVPMAGYGAGAFLLALLTTEPEPFDALCPLPPEPPVEDGGAGPADAGGGDGGGADAAGQDAHADATADSGGGIIDAGGSQIDSQESDTAVGPSPDAAPVDAGAADGGADAGADAGADGGADGGSTDAAGDVAAADVQSPPTASAPGDDGCSSPAAAPLGLTGALLALLALLARMVPARPRRTSP